MSGAIKRLRKVKQTGGVKEYLMKFNNAVADCSTISGEDKLKYFVEGLNPEIRRFVYVCRPGTMSEAIKLATYLWEDVENEKKDREDRSKDRRGEFHRPTYMIRNPKQEYCERGWLRAPEPNPRFGVVWKPGNNNKYTPPPMKPGRGIVGERRFDLLNAKNDLPGRSGYMGNGSKPTASKGQQRGGAKGKFTWGPKGEEERRLNNGPKSQGERYGIGNSRYFCYTCGDPGHFSWNCPRKRRTVGMKRTTGGN